MKQFIAFILFFALLCNIAVGDGITVGIKLVEQKIYFLNDDIDIKITVRNGSTGFLQFRIADNRVFSLDFDVRTATNRPEQYHSKSFANARNTMKPVFYRDISLAPGEEYSLIVNFTDYIALGQPGLYIVHALFFPDLYMSESSPSIPSNTLTLNLRPAIDSPAEKSAVEAQIEKELQRGKLPPDEVVAYMLTARQGDQWERFFLYLNLDELYINSHLKNKQDRDQYLRLSEADKMAKREWYRNQILGQKAEYDLVLRTHSFKIEETSYTAHKATVTVRQEYQHSQYREPRRYIYTLRKNGNTWEIVDYEMSISNTGGR